MFDISIIHIYMGENFKDVSDDVDASAADNDVAAGNLDCNFSPSYWIKPLTARQADVLASGAQAPRQRPSKLVPDGLRPDEHLKAAKRLQHPFLKVDVSTAAVRNALEPCGLDSGQINAFRHKVCECLQELASCTEEEDKYLITLAHPYVAAVLRAYKMKKVAFMREVCFVCQPEDYAAVPSLLIGLPMLGWACPAFGLMNRVSPPTHTIDEWLGDRIARNMKIIARISSSGDQFLDEAAYSKTIDEVKAGVTEGPFTKLEDVPICAPCLAPRVGIWENHGEAVADSVRNIDNLLLGMQNATAGTTHSHRPTDVDALVAQARAVSEAFPSDSIRGWTSDFSKAYKQIPADPAQVGSYILAQFSPVTGLVAFFLTFCQVFGSKSAPLNFSRFPALLCFLCAVLFCLPLTHCVDDVICFESLATSASGKYSWDLFMELCGWLMNADKKMSPAACFYVIGVSIDLRPLPQSWPTLMITQKRIKSLEQLLTKILHSGVLGSGLAASVAGKLGFSLSACFGRFGRCRLRPLVARAYSPTVHLSPHLKRCIEWWLAFIKSYCPRPIPTSINSLPLLISYSDGEGGLAGIGAAVWQSDHTPPLAVYSEVPERVRDYWLWASQGDVYSDIFLVEALGPLILLCAFPNIIKRCLWIHFIDNTAAEASLIRGASSNRCGDHVVGLTWQIIQHRQIWAYFDRVESSANPVDGISRRKFNGPWDSVYTRPFPLTMLADFALTFGDCI